MEKGPKTDLNSWNMLHKSIVDYLNGEGKELTSFLLILDIDNFSSINNKLGRSFGDSLLINISAFLASSVLSEDLFGRIGGDEFMILLKNITKEDCIHKVSTYCESIRHIYSGNHTDISVSVSIGVAEFPVSGTNFNELFENAQKALVYAKKRSKNTYVDYSEIVSKTRDSKDASDTYTKEQVELEYQAYGIVWLMASLSRILSTSTDIEKSIYILLDYVGRFCQCDNICIYESTISEDGITATYQWDVAGGSKIDNKISYSFDRWPDYCCSFDKNGILKVNDCSLLSKDIEIPESVGAFLQSGIFDGNEFRGCVSICNVGKPRNWTHEEAIVLTEFSRAVTPYILKNQATVQAKYQLDKAANFDELTGLYTLTGFKYYTQLYLEQHPAAELAIAYSDIVDFKYINDTYGFTGGDEILCDFAKLISKAGAISSARLSNDSFLSLLPRKDEEELENFIVERNRDFNKMEKEKFPYSNILIATGVCGLSGDQNGIIQAIDNANIARKTVKSQKKSGCSFFNDNMKQLVSVEAEMSNRMEYALEQEEFLVYLQPKVSLETNKLMGAEALVRWQSGSGEIIPPNNFIPFFEKNGFIIKLDHYVLKQILIFIRHCMDNNIKIIPISVNLSRLHGDCIEEVTYLIELVRSYGVSPVLIEFELTETAFFDDSKRLKDMIKKLMNLGFRISIDDFGSGYSSLNILPTIPANILKMDKEFLQTAEFNERNQILIKHIISMAKDLEFQVVFEGVETEDNVEFLKLAGCTIAQGYFFSRPVPMEEFEEKWLK